MLLVNCIVFSFYSVDECNENGSVQKIFLDEGYFVMGDCILEMVSKLCNFLCEMYMVSKINFLKQVDDQSDGFFISNSCIVSQRFIGVCFFIDGVYFYEVCVQKEGVYEGVCLSDEIYIFIRDCYIIYSVYLKENKCIDDLELIEEFKIVDKVLKGLSILVDFMYKNDFNVFIF